MSKSSQYCTLYIVRHGQSQANLDKILAGQSDYDLTETGVEQAKSMQKILEKVHFDFAFSSDLIRAKRTAEIITAEHNLTVAAHHLLRERHFGRFQDQSYQMVEKEYDMAYERIKNLAFSERRKEKLFDDVESDDEVISRYITILREIAIGHLGQTGLIGSHGNAMRFLLMHLDLDTFGELAIGAIDNTGYIVLDSDGVDFFVRETQGINH